MKPAQSSLPTSAEATQAEIARRSLAHEFDEILDRDEVPVWAKRAFASAINSIPVVKEALAAIEDKSEAYRRGFFCAAFAEDVMPFWEKLENFSKEQAHQNPTNTDLSERAAVVSKYGAKIREAIRKTTGDFFAGEPALREDFIAGMDAWRKRRPSNWNSALGNLATMPNLYLAIFWKEFAKLPTLKETYDALLSMFDRNKSLAGSFEAFRKRVRKYGLTYLGK